MVFQYLFRSATGKSSGSLALSSITKITVSASFLSQAGCKGGKTNYTSSTTICWPDERYPSCRCMVHCACRESACTDLLHCRKGTHGSFDVTSRTRSSKGLIPTDHRCANFFRFFKPLTASEPIATAQMETHVLSKIALPETDWPELIVAELD